MEHVFPKYNLELVIEHHDTDGVTNQNEHLVVNIGMLVDVPSHSFCRGIILRTAELIAVFAHFLFCLIQFAQIYAVQQKCPDQLSVVLYQVEDFFPELPFLVIKHSFR